MKRKAAKSDLTDEQKADAARLKALIDSTKRGPERFTIEAIAEKSGVGTASFVSQLAHAYRPINLEQTVLLAKALSASIEQISPTHAATIRGVRIYSGDPPPPPTRNHSDYSGLERAAIGALRSLDPTVREAIRSMILAVASASSENHAKFMHTLQQLSEARDRSAKPHPCKGAIKRRTS